jgi:signal transduction histidine kinase
MGEKSGLGLSLVYNLVNRKLKGSIELLPDAGSGNHFPISVPRN